MSTEPLLQQILLEGASPSMVALMRRLLACACPSGATGGTGPLGAAFIEQTGFGALTLDSFVQGVASQLLPGYGLSSVAVTGGLVGEVQTRTRTISLLAGRLETPPPSNAPGAEITVAVFVNGVVIPSSAMVLDATVALSEMVIAFDPTELLPGDLLSVDVTVTPGVDVTLFSAISASVS